ncbi:MAG TPA: hypothetical protein VII28_06915 [Puia sp.]
MRNIKIALLAGISFFFTEACFCQGTTKASLILNLGYYNDNNQMQYLKAATKTKVNGKFKFVGGVPVSFYISSEGPANLIGKAITNEKGQASLLILPIAKDEWNKSPRQTFLAVSDSSRLFDAVKTSVDLSKSRIKIDTAEDKKIVATLLELKDSLWVPVKGVDMKLAVKRLGGDLNVNETPTYTTDSLGMVNADFKLLNLPGDSLGNLILIAKVEDNDVYGNLTTEKTVPWGTVARYQAPFNERSLFARRGWSPLWLEWMAYSIIIAVWFVLLYLFIQIRKIIRLGN